MNIVVVGSINLDLITIASRFPQKGETMFGIDSRMLPGGKGANQAISAAKLGANVHMVGCVGDDEYGKILLNNFKDHHVSIDDVTVIEECVSGSAQITIADNDNSIIIVSGANQHVDCAYVDKHLQTIRNADLVITQCEIPLETVSYVIDICNDNNIPVILNPAPAQGLSTELLEKATFVTPNEIEIEQLFGSGYENILMQHPNQFITTFGKDGVKYSDGKHIIEVPAYVVDVVDTTGAGDTFNAAFAVWYCKTKDIEESVKFANLAASKTIQAIGAQSAMPSIEDLEDF